MAESETSIVEKMALSTGRKKIDDKPPTPPTRVPEKHPHGVASLFISDDTCKKFNIEKKNDIQNNTHFKANTIMVKEDMELLGIESDFFPLKNLLMNYYEEYFLLRYITDDRYVCNHNFELVYLAEVREAIIKELEDKTNALRVAEGPKFWINLGSDVEVDAEIVKNSRGPVKIQATKPRKDYYQKATLLDRESYETWTSAAMECRPFQDPTFDGQFMDEQETTTQAIPTIKDIGVQTIQKVHRNNQVQYQPITQENSKIKEILSSKEIGDFLSKVKYRYVDALQQNEIFDLFEDEFSQFADDDNQHGDKVVTSISEYQSFSELDYGKNKMVSAINWMPGKQGIVAVALTAVHSFDERIRVAHKVASSHVLLWAFSDPVHPWAVLESTSDVFSLRFNPIKPTLIAGGCYNGQVTIWDITKAQDYHNARDGKEPEEPIKYLGKEKKKEKKTVESLFVQFLLLSTMETSHTSIVSDIHWLPKDFQLNMDGIANNGETNLIASVSVDGMIIFWDITSSKEPELDLSWSDERKWAAFEEQKYKWTPLYRIELKFENRRFGEVAEVDLDISTSSPNITKVTRVHEGPVRTILQSPFLDDVLLTVGIWTFALWRNNIEKPLYVSRSSNSYFTTGCWSPSRPAIVYIGLIDGTIEVWDLLEATHQPSMIVHASSSQITTMEFWKMKTPQFLAVGDIQGVLHVLEIPRSLRRATYKEKPAFKNFMVRQQAWVVDVEIRAQGREAEIAKQKAILDAEKERKEQFNKACTWDDEVEAHYLEFEDKYRQLFKDGERNSSSAESSPLTSPQSSSP